MSVPGSADAPPRKRQLYGRALSLTVSTPTRAAYDRQTMMIESLVLIFDEPGDTSVTGVERETKWLDAATLDVSLLTSGVRKVHKLRCDQHARQ